MKRYSFFVFFILVSCFSPGSVWAAEEEAPPLATIESGPIRGELLGAEKDIVSFKGIPFAAPPVGALRWKPPQPVKSWKKVRPCIEYEPWCPQPKQIIYRSESAKKSEDCLYLNVWAPVQKGKGEKLPVMVWIHGGGFTTGSGASKTYNGEVLARERVVVVTINYRLGPFGFFAHPLLSKESEKGVSGNYGMLDQVAALRWVQSNIAAFRGDPENVTIFGESAGSASVCRLMVTPLSKGLFHRAIAQSGAAQGRNRHLRERWYNLEPMERLGARIAEKLDCHKAEDPLAALRAKSAEELLSASSPSQGLFGKGNRFGPVVDGWVLPDDPTELFAKGKQHPVPLMIGSNADEATVFLGQLPIKGTIGYAVTVRLLYGKQADRVMALFPAKGNEREVKQTINKLVTVSAFVAPARALAKDMERIESKAFLYHFTRVPLLGQVSKLGAFHGLEIPYVFGHLDNPMGYSPPDHRLSKIMRAAWARFAKTGDPNGAGLPEWPAYAAKTDLYMDFGDEVKVKSGLYREACDLVEEIIAERLMDRRK